jgi:hypothetical protein
MNGIYTTDNSFDFHALHLAKPYQIPGGNFFIRISTDNKPLYIQPPKCTTKQGILKAGKKFYTDLMFTNEHADFIEWMEKLESHCQTVLYNNRGEWFEGEMEMHDIENYFTAPLKLYKSGKFYISRVNITTNLGKPTLKIYNEEEQLVSIDDVNDKMNIMSILEIKGIKCSATCFQIDIDVKQMMVLKPENLFDSCLFTPKKVAIPIVKDVVKVEEDASREEKEHNSDDGIREDAIMSNVNESDIPLENNEVIVEDVDSIDSGEIQVDTADLDEVEEHLEINNIPEKTCTTVVEEKEEIPTNSTSTEKTLEEVDMQEIDLSLDEIPEDNHFSIKNKKNVYYEMYKEAKRKAKVARDLALSSYLEAKRIKNVYMLDDASDSEDSDYENIEEKVE